MRDGEAAAEEGALQVDVDDAVPLLLGDLVRRALRPDAGGVDERVQRARGLDRGRDDALAAGDAADVGLDGIDGAADLRRAP